MRIKIVLGERRKSRFRSLVARSKNLVGDLFSIGGIWSLPTQNVHIPVLVYIAAEAANINCVPPCEMVGIAIFPELRPDRLILQVLDGQLFTRGRLEGHPE